jgi:four helix bundle protein
MTLQTHKDLKVWQDSRKLVKDIYALTSKFPKDEMYSITAQIKRAAISIPSNIAEGAARDSNKEYIHFLFIALGSIAELDTQLIIANDLNFIGEKDFNNIIEKLDNIGKMLSGLIKYRQSKRN